MNICIVTVYNSENCGSFYQAYALSKILEKKGHNVCFLKREAEGTSHDFDKIKIDSIKAFFHGHPVLAKRNLEKYHAFEQALSSLKIIQKSDPQYDEIDCFVIGSDTVWNFEEPYFYKNKRTYVGSDFERKKVTYAVSISNTSYERLYSDKEIIDGIANLDAISVRDFYTYECLNKKLGVKPEIVLDPTLLLSQEEYEEKETLIPYKDYILIYGFKDLSKKMIDSLKLRKKKIVSYGIYRAWADVNVIFNPNTFLTFFHNADYVVTDTFHGTIFSIVYKKQFVCYGKEKKKVEDLLRQLNLLECIVDDKKNIVEQLQTTISYDIAYERLQCMKQQSVKFIDNNIENIK